MSKYICVICGNEVKNKKQCSNCNSFFVRKEEEISVDDFGFTNVLTDEERDNIDFENFSLEDYEDDSKFDDGSIIPKKDK